MKNKVDLEKFSKNDLQKIADTCLSRTEFSQALGYSYFNGQISKKIAQLIEQNTLSVSHFNATYKNKIRQKYPVIIKKCPVCQVSFETKMGHKKEKITCSTVCSNTYFYDERYNLISNEKRKESLKIFHEENGSLRILKTISCLYCKCVFQTFIDKTFCNNSCSAKYNWNFCPEYRENLTKQVNARVASGQHKGWSSRLKISPSFPEKITLEILLELNLSLEREFKVDKYFIDFADKTRKIALEIDGKQHEFPERKVKDLIKDQYLISQGWIIFRIKWKKFSKEFREELKNKIIDIFK